MTKLPKDFIQEIENTYKERNNWKTVRLFDIQKTSKQIYKFDDNTDAYREAMDNVSRLHSGASKVAQVNFRNRFLCVTSPKSIFLQENNQGG